jgi:hypothetical protein
MGFEDSKQTWGEYGQQVLVSLKNTGDSVKKMFAKSSPGTSTGTTSMDGSESDASSDYGGDAEDPSAKARRERKERRLKKKRGQHSSLELDDTMDM